jgi:hypothetical protein
MNVFKKILNKFREAFKTPEYVSDPRVYILYKGNDDYFYDIKICKESVAKANNYYILGSDDDTATSKYLDLMLKARNLCETENEKEYYVCCIRWFYLRYHGMKIDENLNYVGSTW